MRGSFRIAQDRLIDKLDIKCVEVGVNASANAVRMLKGLPQAIFYLVDSYDVTHETFKYSKDGFTQEERGEFIKKTQAALYPFGERANLIIKDSVEASKDFEDEFFDYIYIDADHDYESVKRDLEAWWPKIKKGGIFAGHDYGAEVKKAVDEKFGPVYNGEEGDWWIIK